MIVEEVIEAHSTEGLVQEFLVILLLRVAEQTSVPCSTQEARRPTAHRQ